MPNANDLAAVEAARTRQELDSKRQRRQEFDQLVKLRLAAPKGRPTSAPHHKHERHERKEVPPPADGDHAREPAHPIYVSTTGHATGSGSGSLSLRTGEDVEKERAAVLKMTSVRKTTMARDRKAVQLRLHKEREAGIQRAQDARLAKAANRVEGDAKRLREESEAQRMELHRRQQLLEEEAHKDEEVVQARAMAELRKSRFAVAMRATLTEQVDMPLDLPPLCFCGGSDPLTPGGNTGEQSLVWGVTGWAVPSQNCPYKDECDPPAPLPLLHLCARSSALRVYGPDPRRHNCSCRRGSERCFARPARSMAQHDRLMRQVIAQWAH